MGLEKLSQFIIGPGPAPEEMLQRVFCSIVSGAAERAAFHQQKFPPHSPTSSQDSPNPVLALCHSFAPPPFVALGAFSLFPLPWKAITMKAEWEERQGTSWLPLSAPSSLGSRKVYQSAVGESSMHQWEESCSCATGNWARLMENERLL